MHEAPLVAASSKDSDSARAYAVQHDSRKDASLVHVPAP